MNRKEIFAKVVESADRFGAGNPQRFKLLGSLLARGSPEEVFLGLLAVFVECPRDDKHLQRQKLAGRLLAEMNPGFGFELAPAVRAALQNYHPSIEQLPQHFARAHGLAAVQAAFKKIEDEELNERERIPMYFGKVSDAGAGMLPGLMMTASHLLCRRLLDGQRLLLKRPIRNI